MSLRAARWVLIVMWALVKPALAVSPLLVEKPTEGQLTALRLLARHELTEETLVPVLGFVNQDLGRDYRIALILATAVRSGELPQQVVERSMAVAGCKSESEKGQCRSFRDLFRSALYYLVPSTSPDDLRTQLLKLARERTGGNYFLEASYARSLIESKRITASQIFAGFLSGDPRTVEDSQGEDVFMALGRVTMNGEPVFLESVATGRWRKALGTAFGEILRGSRGDPALVKEVRDIPEDALKQARELDARSWPDSIGQNILCVIDKWRVGDAVPDRWTAWSDALVCCGW